jgi:hypothetical protein
MNLRPRQANVFLTWQLKLLAAQVLTHKAPVSSQHLVAPNLALSVQQYVNKVLDSWQTGNTLDKQIRYIISFTMIFKLCLYPQQLTLTSSTSGGCSVGIVRSRTQAMELSFFSLGRY